MEEDRRDLATSSGEDLFALADRVADMVGGPVILEDPVFRVLAYSAYSSDLDRGRAEAILGRRIPQEWLDHLRRTGALQRLTHSDDVVAVADGPWRARPRLIAGVHHRGRHVGVLWVTEADMPLEAESHDALREAAAMVAPALHRHGERVAAEADRRGRHVRGVLDGHAGQAALVELGIGSADVLTVLAVSSDGDDEPTASDALLAHVNLCCEISQRPVTAARFGRDVVALLRTGPRDDLGYAERVGHELVRLAGHGTLAPVRVGISTPGRVSAGPRLRDEAVAALAATSGQEGQLVASFDQVEAQVVVHRIVERLGADLRLSGVDRLVAYDEHRGTELAASLRAYLACDRSARAAAQLLGVHATTVQYRLSRIVQISRLDLEDPDVRLAAQLVLRTRRH